MKKLLSAIASTLVLSFATATTSSALPFLSLGDNSSTFSSFIEEQEEDQETSPFSSLIGEQETSTDLPSPFEDANKTPLEFNDKSSLPQANPEGMLTQTNKSGSCTVDYMCLSKGNLAVIPVCAAGELENLIRSGTGVSEDELKSGATCIQENVGIAVYEACTIEHTQGGCYEDDR